MTDIQNFMTDIILCQMSLKTLLKVSQDCKKELNLQKKQTD